MKKKLWLGLFAMLMVVAITLSRGTVSNAEWDEDWDDNESCKCFYCEDTLRDSDDYCQCDMGAPHCSESHNSGCWESLHCANFDECGQTIEDSSICEDCGLCKDCQEKEGVGTHCSECGNCGSPICDECSDDDHLICKDCAEMQGYHCIGCGGCFQSIEVCEKSADEDTERAMCKDCCEAAGNHCTECHEHVGDGTDVFWCFCDSGPGDHCGYCGMEDNNGKHCEGCDKYFCVFNGDDLSKFCDECDMCFDCCFEQVKHCPICENEVSERCESDGEHCTDCCDLCEQCERCLLAEDIERCEHCDLCLECCRENAEEAGCGCGEYCKEESGFEEHLCEECGICFGVNPKCEYCGFCEICCLEKSEEAGCSEGMCVEDPDFEDHFCSECNECFHSVDRCGTCEAANVNVCENCCASISSDLGCGHGICPNSDYWNCHFDSETSECYVNEDEYGEDQHDFRNSTTCYVCGAQRDGRPHILVQPKNRTVKVGKDAASAEKAVFSVTAQGSNLTYQWYTGLGSKITDTDFYKGTTSSQLTVAVNICNADIDAAIAEAEAKNDTRLVNTLNQIKKLYSYYCVVTNSESGLSVKSDTAVLTTKHNVSEFRADKGKYHSAQYKIQNGDEVKVEWTTSDSHCKTCVGGWYNASDEDAIILKMVSTCDLHEASEPHVWTSWNYNTEYPAYKGQNGYASRSCMVCKTVEYKAYEYVEPHEHVWANKPELFMTTIKQKDGSGKVTEVPYDGYHARRCTVEGCPEYSEKEEHIWSEYEITIAATDHSQGERVRHCLVCDYVQTETISPLYHKHDFPVKNPLTGWYDSDDMPYVYHSNRTHYVTCKGVVYNEKTGAYEPCPAKANYEQHSLTMEYIDGDNYPTHWAKFRFTCHCGFSKVYKTDDTPNINYDHESIGVYRLFSTFPNFKWTFNGQTHYASDTGNPAKIPNGAEVTIYNETGYRLNSGTWQDCIYTVDDIYIRIKDSQFYEVTFIMPMRDVFVDFQLLDLETLTEWECPHWTTTYYDQATAIETTCTKSGKDPDLKCSECHVTLEVGKTHAALGHNFVLDKSTIVYSTCTAKGYTGDSICANCGKKQKGIETPADGHDTKDCYYWDDNKHWPYCGVCEKEFKAQADKHRFDVTVVSQGVTYEMCSICKFYRVKEGIATGRNYTHTVYVNDDSDNVNVRVRFYPTTVSDEDIAKDMEKETSELGTEYGCLVSDNYKTSIYPGYTRCIQYDVLNAPQNQSNTYYKIAVTLGKEYIPYIVERNNFNLTGYLRLKEYTVSFQANGGSGSMESVTVKSGATYTLPACAFTAPEGIVFDGWKIGGTNYQVGAKITVSGTTNVTATWKAVHDKTDANLKIAKKSITLYDTITIEFKVPETAVAGYRNPYLVVTQNGITEKLTEYKVKDGLLIFTFRVAPHWMREEATAVPYGINADGEIVMGKALTYSVAQYCYNMLGSETYQDAKYATFRRLLVDILRYGDAAQLYAGYKTSELAGKDLTAAQIAMGTDVSLPMNYNSVRKKKFATVDAKDELASIETAALFLEAAVNIQFKYEANDLTGLRVVITGDAAGTEVLGEYEADANQIDDNGRYYVSLKNLNAAQMKKTVYATVMKGDKKVSNTYCYSIESYVAAVKGKYSDQLDNLLDSMMRYGNTAADYVAGR